MRMQKEEKVVVVLLLMALGSLAVAFWAFSSDSFPSGSFDSDSSDSASGSLWNGEGKAGGQSISLQGSIVELKRTGSGGHLLISLDSTSLPVFVPARSGAEELAGALKRGDRIEVKGTVREYQGREEIEVSRSSDVGRMN